MKINVYDWEIQGHASRFFFSPVGAYLFEMRA